MSRLLSITTAAIGAGLLVAALGCEGAEATPKDDAATPPPPVEARSSVDKAVATTGDLITYEVVLEHDEGIAVAVPDPGDQIAGFRIVDLGVDPPVNEDGRITERRWYSLRADLVGSYVLPGVRLSYVLPAGAKPKAEGQQPKAEGQTPKAEGQTPKAEGQTPKAEGQQPKAEDQPPKAEGQQPKAEGQQPKAEDQPPKAGDREVLTTSEIFVEVKSVLPKDGEATDIRDLKSLEKVEQPLPWVAIGGAGAVLLLLGAIAVVVIRRRRRAATVPAIPAHELAFAALNDLRHTDFDDPDAVRAYYFRISEIVRQYVEGRFVLNATDLTTEEIVARLGGVPDLAPTPQGQLREFLVDTDTVKFAGYAPSSQQIGDTYERALSFVEQTVPPEPEAAPSEQREAA